MSEKIGKLRLEVAGVIIFVVIVLAIMIAIQGDRISDMNKQVKNLQSQVETLQMAMDQDPTQVEESAQLEQTKIELEAQSAVVENDDTEDDCTYCYSTLGFR